MNDLTIKEIKDKQKELRNNITKLLKDFNKETGVDINGQFNWGVESGNQPTIKMYNLRLHYSNPFQPEQKLSRKEAKKKYLKDLDKEERESVTFIKVKLGEI